MAARQQRGAALITVGAMITLVGTFLPWMRSGARDRSSYAIFELVGRLGFAPEGLVSTSLRVWPLVPLLVVGSVVGSWVPSPRPALRMSVAMAAMATALWVGATAVAVRLAPAAGLVRDGPGPIVTIAGSIAVVVGAGLSCRGSAASGAS